MITMKANTNDHIKLTQKDESALTEDVLSQINQSLLKEFKVSLPPRDPLFKKLFFLLQRDNTILAMGALMEVQHVMFDEEEFTIYGFVEVVANEKGRGYGKQVVEAMTNYLRIHDKTGIGFCMPRNKGFYEKCGLETNTISTQRFVYIKEEERITNQDGQIIFYHDSSDNFMKKVLSKPGIDVYIPTGRLW